MQHIDAARADAFALAVGLLSERLAVLIGGVELLSGDGS
jgi:hypothetical protein